MSGTNFLRILHEFPLIRHSSGPAESIACETKTDSFHFVLEVQLVLSKNTVVMRHSGDKGIRISSVVSFIYPQME